MRNDEPSQTTMFDHGDDLPLFSGVCERAQEQRPGPSARPVQPMLEGVRCRLCQDTGVVNLAPTNRPRKFRYCTCEEGRRAAGGF